MGPIGEGEQAPDFVRPDHHGTQVRLSDVWSSGTLVLVFYPFAFTGVCTGELRALVGALPRFSAANARVLAVSCDSMFTLRVFADQEGLTFPLLSDFWPHGEVARSYGVFDEERGCALRGTFIVDRSGVVQWSVVNPLPDARDVDDYLKVVERLRT